VKKLQRLQLSPELVAGLADCAAKVQTAPDPKAKAKALWKSRDQLRDAIHDRLRAMTSGVERCMYCEDGAGSTIDHFWPKAPYPERAFDWMNYLLACVSCNSNHKRDLFPLDPDGLPLLIDPTAEDPRQHLVFSPTTGKYAPRNGSPKGIQSISVFGLYRGTLEKGRRLSWTTLQGLIVRYDQCRADERLEDAARFEEALRGLPFSSLLGYLVEMFDSSGRDFIDADCQLAMAARPEVRDWI